MGGKVEGWYMPKFRACRQSSVYLVQAGDRVKSSTQDDIRLMEPPLPPPHGRCYASAASSNSHRNP